MSGHHSIFTMLTVLMIFMGMYFIALIIYEIKKRIKNVIEKHKASKD